ncbi:MAG: isoprenoid biosynthesis glyoxalase ElbB [candidate division Zixibacteria bacterium]|nr:isoprenoid biosynthesis glyoxalase ElbB [candidate division Zixibacteria bacterium]
MRKIAVVLSGCGVNDGAEIHESVVTLLAIKRNGAEYACFAPDKPQLHVIDHVKGALAEETRNVLTESARIARGVIKPLSDYNPGDFDALIFPGGFGAAKNLFTFAIDGVDCSIDDEVKNSILSTNKAGKTIGAMCIAPALLAKAFEGSGKSITVTIGQDDGVASAIETMGAKHKKTAVTDTCIDTENKIVTTPAYMATENIADAAEGIEKLVSSVIKMC